MGKHEVTQGEYLAVMGENPSWFNGIQKIYDEQSSSYIDFDYGVDLNRPVEFVTWDDAIAYCEALTTQERASNRIPQGYAYQLPTEAQWEVACRGGTMTRFSFGNDPEYTELTNYAWYKDNSDNQTHPVGQKLANPWGLYDMHGNVIEWCQDRWTFELPGGSEVDPRGPESGSGARVVRGGSWFDWETGSRSAARMQSRYLAFGVGYIGFRVVLAPARL
jgi:formylglycine-generating enzyme required for sulfatase activity